MYNSSLNDTISKLRNEYYIKCIIEMKLSIRPYQLRHFVRYIGLHVYNAGSALRNKLFPQNETERTQACHCYHVTF